MSFLGLDTSIPPYLKRLYALVCSAKPDYSFYVLLFAFLAYAQFTHSLFGMQHDTFSTTAIVQFFGLALVIYAYWRGFLFTPQWKWWHWLVLAWVVWGWLAALYSPWPAPAISRQVEWMLVMLVVLATAGAIKSGRVSATGVMVVIALGLIVHTSNMQIRWFTVFLDPHKIDWMYWFYPYTHIRHFGYLMAVYIVVSLYFSLYAQRSTLRWLATAGFVVATALLIWSGSRGAIVAVVATLAFSVLFMVARQRYRALATIVVGGGAAYLLQLPFWVKDAGLGVGGAIARSVSEQGPGISNGRLEIWERAIGYLVNHPWFGLGPDGFRFWLEKPLGIAQPHSAYFQTALEWGLIGMLLFWVIIGFYWLNYLIQLKTNGINETFAAFLVVTVLLVHGLTDGTLYHVVSLMHFAVAFGVMITRVETTPPRVHAPIPPASPQISPFARPAIALLILLSTGVIGLNGYIVWRQDQPPVPHPDSWQVALIKAFPTSIRNATAERWLREWKASDPAASTEWRDWLIDNSQNSRGYLLMKALELKAQGDDEAARAIIQDLLRYSYSHTLEWNYRETLMRLLEPSEPTK